MRRRWIEIARGDAPADLVLRGGRVVSVFTGEIFDADVAIADGYVVGVGRYRGPIEFDVTGQYLTPGFIDGHCHIESSKLDVANFARTVLARGTTSVVVDPHELANVAGLAGIRYVLAASEALPLNVFVKLPSCVPASPFESPAGDIEACDYGELLDHPRVIGIAEMMNYPAAINGQPSVLAKMALTRFRSIDGHAPGVRGNDLCAYIVSGPSSDHECTTLEEALEKRRLGMWIMIREATMIRNLHDLLPLVRKYGTDNTMFVTDDREAGTLLSEGHMNSMVRAAVNQGISAADAIKLASLNVARYHGLTDRGALAPGYRADILVLPDLIHFEPEMVFAGGEQVKQEALPSYLTSDYLPARLRNSVKIRLAKESDFEILAENCHSIRAVRLVPDQVVTIHESVAPRVMDRCFVADPSRDLAKLVVVERHHASGRVGRGFVQGFGLRRGAFASSVAHDAHNLVAVGVNDADLALCVNHLAEIGGGLCVCCDGQVLDDFPLEIAGLMSLRSAQEVHNALLNLEGHLRTLGVTVDSPFMHLSFLALSVIPEIRVTDQGIVDVVEFKLVSIGAS